MLQPLGSFTIRGFMAVLKFLPLIGKCRGKLQFILTDFNGKKEIERPHCFQNLTSIGELAGFRP